MPLDFYDIDDDEHQRWRNALAAPTSDRKAKRFLMVFFRCCHTYGRLNRNRAGTRYEGRCPRCGAAIHARIGPGGTSQRMFEAR
jgi:hypothetical protein